MNRITAITFLSLCAAGVQAQTFDNDSVTAHIPAMRRVPETVVSAGGSLVINAAVTEVLKHTVHEMRPDRSSNNSFPSRHTSWAFTASTVLSNELFMHSPWYSLGTQAVASAVGYQRIHAGRHYASDVIAGAVTGVLSTELAYLISRKVFGSPSPWSMYRAENDFRPTLAMSTSAVFSFSSSWCTGFGMAVDFRLPLDESWGVTAAINSTATPVKTGAAGMTDAVCTAGFQLGAVWHHTLPVWSLAVEPVAAIGASRLFNTGGMFKKYEMTARAGAGLSWRLTRSFGCRAEACYTFGTGAGTRHGVTIGISSVSVF